MNRRSLLVLVCLSLTIILGSARKASAAPGPLPQPVDIACQGNQRDTVVISWKDKATDETDYRVERSIGGASFSEIATLAADSGRFDDTGADVSSQNRRYRVRSFRSSDSSFSPYSNICNNRRIFDPGNFRFFFGLRNTTDDCPQIDGHEACLTDTNDASGTNVFIVRGNDALQGSVDAFTRVGFTRNAASPPSGLDKIPINVSWCDGGGCAFGGSLTLSPFMMEKPFDLTTRSGDPIAWLVALHEAFHFQQTKYGGLNDPANGWVIEGQARSVQDKLCIGADRATCQAFDDIETGDAGYVPWVKGYLGNPSISINKASYSAALFWTYLTEKYGTSAPGDTIEGGMDIMVRFWEESAANTGQDGISVINKVLTTLGHTERFRDVWKDFAVANYAKELSGPGVQTKYLYADMAQPGGNYGPVRRDLLEVLSLDEQVVDTDESVQAWGAHYYEVQPAADVPVIDIKVTQDSTVPLYYTILGIRGTDVTLELNSEARNLNRTLINNGYDRVVLIVAGLENRANYRYSFNGTQPSLRILNPTTSNVARVGAPSAPDKFRVTLEVVAGDGTPLTGVDLANFSFRVGAQDVLTSNILTSATVQGQQWFVLRAPAQTTTGVYDLQVNYGTILTDTEISAVSYTPRTDADSMLVIDRSGSMLDFGKMDAAKAAARLYVDSWRVGDKIGIVSFNEAVTLDMGLTDWTDTPSGGSRQTAFAAIDPLTAGGNTAIGDAIRSGWNEINAKGNSGHDWALVLLSDGLETAGTESFDTVINALQNATGKRPVVHAVAVGPDADRPRMQSVATRTGGTYQYVSTPASSAAAQVLPLSTDILLDMDLRHRVIATNIVGQQQFFSMTGPLNDGNPNADIVTIPVEGSAAEMVLSLSWDPSQGFISDAFLRDPNNVTVNPFERDTRHMIWRVPNPAGGNWSLDIQTIIIPLLPAQADDFLSPYLIQAAVRSDVTMEVYYPTPLEERTPGVAMPIVASLTDTGPILNATMQARIETPSGAMMLLSLYDDGAHEDGQPNDGLYANVFYQTGMPGSYDVTVNATGTSPLSGVFARQVLSAFHIFSNGDGDGDGLPDEWEERYGTDPSVNDASSDPDNDGCSNQSEWETGTNPLNSDTDGGGVADCSDANPFDPSDDNLEPTWAVAYPGNGKVIIKYVLRPEYVTVDLFRSNQIEGPFTLLQQENPGTGVIIDTAVTNGQTYCYQTIGIDSLNRRTAGLTPSCATPKEDPLGPHGYVLINDGAQSTSTPNVTITLWASDSVDPEFVPPGDEILLPPQDSATTVTEMMISNRGDFSDGVWEPYATQKPWQLETPLGLATVFAKFRDAAGNESDPAIATIQVQPEAELTISKTASPHSVSSGQNLTYTIEVINNGPDDATGVIVTDTLPAGVTFVSATPSVGTCSLGPVVTCEIGELANGANATITIDVTVDPAVICGSILTNRAVVSSNESDADLNNNTVSTDTMVTCPPEPCTILDDFNRPNGPLGSNWDGRTNGYRIVNNEVVVRAGGPIYWQPEKYGVDQEACVTLTQINPKSRQHALLLKVQELNDWRQGAILVSYDARSGNVDIEARDVNNKKWILVSSLTPSTPVVNGDQLRAQALADGTVEVFINDVSIGTADTGSFYVDKGGQIGLWFLGRQGDDDNDDNDNDENNRDNDDDRERLIQARERNSNGDDEHDGDDDDDDDGSSAARRALLDDFGGGTLAAPAPALSCLDIQALTPFPQTFPGPTFALAPLDFMNPMDSLGVPLSIDLTDRVEDLDGKPELFIGSSSNVGGFQPLYVEFPSISFPTGVKDVSVELRHFAIATVLALDNGSAVISTATQPTQNVRASLMLPGSGIRRLQFDVVETLLYKICWIP